MSSRGIRSMLLRGGRRRGEAEVDPELLVFGYGCKIFRDDEKFDWLSEQRHLISWYHGDSGGASGSSDLEIDRYDCRLHLAQPEAHEPPAHTREPHPYQDETERLEEQMCEEERYLDLINITPETLRSLRIDAEILDQEHEKRAADTKKGAEISFDYGEEKKMSISDEDDADADDDDAKPYVAPKTLKVPVGMTLPATAKQAAVIDKTAAFIAKEGAQMEIVIKTKQKNNRQFDFLSWDHPLNTFYKYVTKAVKDGRYTPKIHHRQKTAARDAANSTGGEDSSDGEGGDHYLHPLLQSASASSANLEKMDKPTNGTGTPTSKAKQYRLGQENDVYSVLYKKLAHLIPHKEPEIEGEVEEGEGRPEPEDEEDLDLPSVADLQEAVSTSADTSLNHSAPQAPAYSIETGPPPTDYFEWFLWFYGFPSPFVGPQPPPVVPPPPDLQSVIDKTAFFVSRFGPSAENHLRGRAELRLDFLHEHHPFFPYYQMKIRTVQYESYCKGHCMVVAHREPGSSPDHQDVIYGPEQKPSASGTSKEIKPVSFSIKEKKPQEQPLMHGGAFDAEPPLALEFVQKPAIEGPPRKKPSLASTVKYHDQIPAPTLTTTGFADLQLRLERKKRAKLFLDKLSASKKAQPGSESQDGTDEVESKPETLPPMSKIEEKEAGEIDSNGQKSESEELEDKKKGKGRKLRKLPAAYSKGRRSRRRHRSSSSSGGSSRSRSPPLRRKKRRN